MSLAPDSRASHSALPESDAETTTYATCGLPPSDAFSWYDHDTRSWKTFQACLPLLVISEPSSVTWPKAGMMQDGVCYLRPSWERRISEIGSGLLPTIHAQEPGWVIGGQVEVVDKNGNPPEHWNQRFYDRNTGRVVQKGLTQVVKMFLTPLEEARKMGAGNGGQLNPTWVEWLMGWPLGWTDLKPLAMDRFLPWLHAHGLSSLED